MILTAAEAAAAGRHLTMELSGMSEAQQWNCRTDWWIAPAGQDEEESE